MAMVLMKQRTEFIAAALAAANGNKDDEDYLEQKELAEKTFLQEMRKLRKKEKEGKPLTKKQQEVEDLDLTNQSWEKIFVFKGHDDNTEAARDALFNVGEPEDWITAKSGRRGSNKKQSYHGGKCGKFKITTEEDGAYLWAADSNSMNQVLTLEQLPGAEELTNEQEEEGEEEDDDDTLLEELDQIIVSGGKTSQEIKEMPYLDKKMHAQQCDKNRNIKAKDIGDIATKMGCPEEKTTKIAKLMWICTEYLHDPHAYN